MASGFGVAAAGFLLMRFAGGDSSVAPALVGASVIAIGHVVVGTLVTEYALGLAPAERAASVSAVLETATELGGAVGMAVLGSVLAAIYFNRAAALLPSTLAGPAAHAAEQALGQATVVAAQLGGPAGERVLRAGRLAYVQTMHVTDLAGAALLLAGAVGVLIVLPRTTTSTRTGSADTMSNTTMLPLAVAAVALVWVVVAQTRTRPVQATASTIRLLLRWLLLAYSVTLVAQVVRAGHHPLASRRPGHPRRPDRLAVGLGVARGAVTSLWTDRQGRVWRRGGPVVLVLWVVSFAARLRADRLLNQHDPGLGASTILAYLVVSIAAQNLTVRRRAVALPAA